MRGAGAIHQGLVFDVDKGSLASDTALQVLRTIAQVGASLTFLIDESSLISPC